MRIVIVNPAHQSIGSRMPREILPPLGLLAIGGPLIDDGHDVLLIDADRTNEADERVADRIIALAPDAVLIGHNGSTSAHPAVAAIVGRARAGLPHAKFVYGGVFPTYHWREVLEELGEIDIIVRGEGEETTRRLMRALDNETGYALIPGLAFRRNGVPVTSGKAPMIRDLDRYRVGWELIDHANYSYYGGMRGVVVQFSRGCPHLCTFCGQRGYWSRWRHRDPQAFARELGRLHREHGVRLISFADENPTTSPRLWRELLEAIIAQKLDLTMIATLRADDIVRDADMLHLYRKAGFVRVLIGTEHTDEATLEKIRKGGHAATDRLAVQLLRRHGILSLVSYVVGFEDEGLTDYWRAFRKLIGLDPDQIITLFVTPHRWTPFYRQAMRRRVIQPDQRRWDYKHQVLANERLPAFVTFFTIKLLEVAMQARPRALMRTYLNRDLAAHHGMRWYARIGRRVWLHEIWCFLVRDRRVRNGPTLAQRFGSPLDGEENALVTAERSRVPLADAAE